MEKDKIIKVLTAMLGTIEQNQIDLYMKLVEGKCYDDIKNIKDFYFGLIYPHEQFMSGLIELEISTNRDVAFILKNSQFIERHLLYWIVKHIGRSCSVDKSGTILNRLLQFYKDGVRIEFDYTQEYTFHLPKIIFTSHDSIINFYEGVKNLFYGDPVKYLSEVESLITQINEEEKSN